MNKARRRRTIEYLLAAIVVFLLIVVVTVVVLVDSFAKGYPNKKPAAIGDVRMSSPSDLVYQYVDSLYLYYPEYQVPKGLREELPYWGDSSHAFLNIRYFYFGNPPEEVHELQFSGMVYHRCVYKPDNGTLRSCSGGEVGFNTPEANRIITRMEVEVIPKIEELIARDSLAKAQVDSVPGTGGNTSAHN